MALAEVGSLYGRFDEPAKSAEVLQQARRLLQQSGNRRVEGRTVAALGHLRAEQGDHAGAVVLYREAQALQHEAGDRHGEAQTLTRIGVSQSALGEDSAALESQQRALEMYRAIGAPAGSASTLAELARLERHIGRREDARAHVDESLRLIEGGREKMARPEMRAEALARWQEAYRLSAELCLEEGAGNPEGGFAALAFREIERSRARTLLESLAEARVDLARDLPADLRKREEDLESALSELQKKPAGADAASVADARRTYEQDWEGLLADMRRRTPEYASLRYPQPLTPEEVRSGLDARTALVSFVIGRSRSYVFVVSTAGLRIVDLPEAKPAISDDVENYAGLLSSGGADLGPMARRLSDRLVAPWEAVLAPGVDHLVIVPDGPLGYLPFETLPDLSTGRLLLDRFAVSYADSATVFAELSRARPAPVSALPRPALAIFAAPRAPEAFASAPLTIDGERVNLKPLDSALEEGRAVSRLGGAGTRLWTGVEASERRVKTERLDRYRVLHFATHAVLSREAPSRSALVLFAAKDERDDGLLEAREISRMRLNGDLVVLSGCKTAGGRVLPGEGIQSLAQAFIHAGARSVVASLWNVDDVRGTRLMQAFYGSLARGVPKAQALRAAKLEMLRREPGLAPKYWASFVLLGESRERVPLGAATVVAQRIENRNGPRRRWSREGRTSTTQK